MGFKAVALKTGLPVLLCFISTGLGLGCVVKPQAALNSGLAGKCASRTSFVEPHSAGSRKRQNRPQTRCAYTSATLYTGKACLMLSTTSIGHAIFYPSPSDIFSERTGNVIKEEGKKKDGRPPYKHEREQRHVNFTWTFYLLLDDKKTVFMHLMQNLLLMPAGSKISGRPSNGWAAQISDEGFTQHSYFNMRHR
ncbi:hypothetical protein CEXT_760581 [Caerostris extrusa]|uniref:Uncharacterized protein n=1 Tax=Caerostris extrusa TaxID=172846 RepID=A0AAV4VP99_CAEEX|nr:hypothetical protein CEXT_760581 [Caerostris extrusa]